MKKSLLVLFLFASAICAWSQQPDFSMVGYAAMEGEGKYYQPGGTTGGAGGSTVTPSTVDELRTYAESDDPYIIMITKEFKGPTAIKLGSNTTILGVGDNGFINQICFMIQCKHNIIIRNIKMTMKDVPLDNNGENKIQGTNVDPDCIAMQADDDNLPADERVTHHIWIDHCEFYNEDPNVMTEKDRYDGMADMKNDCQYITLSWNYFHDHHKGCLIGKGSSDDYDRTATYIFNRWENISSRIPLVRFSYVHFCNNYVNNCENGMNVRINSNNYVDYNYYKDTKKPVFGKISENGAAHLVDNIFDNCDVPPLDVKDSESFLDTDYVPPYLNSLTRFSASEVPAIITEWSGVGKLSEVKNYTLTVESATGGSITPATSQYPEGTQAVVTAVADAGYEFAGWTGAASGNENPVSITMDSDKTVGAIFTQAQIYSVDILINGNGFVTPDVNGEATGGTTYQITAIPYIGSEFTSWSGSGTGDESALSFTISSDVSITANFTETGEATSFEIEDGYYETGIAKFENSNGGFSGTGYVNTENLPGMWTEITVYAPADGTYECELFYAASDDRPISISVDNAEQISSLAMPNTGDWEVWTNVDFKLTMSKGANTIRFAGTGEKGAPNFDRILIQAESDQPVEQQISLKQGWNLISFNVTADDMSIGSILPNAETVKTFDAFYSKTQLPYLNTLQEITAGEGYLVYNTIDETITISGTPVETHGHVSLQDGWNLIGVQYTEPTSLEDIFGTELQNIQVVKDFDGFWQNGSTLNSLEMLEPGKAYLVKK